LVLNPHSYEANMVLRGIFGEQGKIADSIRILREAVALAPNSAIAWRHLGYIDHYAGLIDLAEAAFRRDHDLDPTPPQPYWMQGRMLLYQGKAHEAEEEVRRALERYPDQFKLLTFLGDFLYYQGKTEEAEQMLERASKRAGPQADEEPMVFSGIVHASRGERDRIDPRIFRYKPEEVVDGDLAEWIGAVYPLLGEGQRALAWLRRAVQLGNHNFPWFQRDKNWDKLRGDAEFQRIMGEVEGYWKHYNELWCEPRLEAALRTSPKDGNAELFLARDLVKLEDLDAAAARLQHLAHTQPADQEVWYLLGKVYMKLSENAISKMNSIDPNSALSHEMSGEIMESMQNYDGALVEYKKAVQMAPAHAGTHYALGNAYWHLGQWDDATEQFRSELQNDPNNCVARWKLANIVLEQDLAPQQALDNTDGALRICPNLIQARVDRARALLKLDRSEDALSELQVAVKSSSDEPSIHFFLAQAYRALGRVQESKSEMEIYSKLEDSARASTAQRAQEVIKARQR
jgi:tetratricopeptide (TPR) repeat protein